MVSSKMIENKRLIKRFGFELGIVCMWSVFWFLMYDWYMDEFDMVLFSEKWLENLLFDIEFLDGVVVL